MDAEGSSRSEEVEFSLACRYLEVQFENVKRAVIL